MWLNFSLQAQSEALDHVEVYLDEFIVIVQGLQYDHTHMTRNMFQAVNILFQPNDTMYIAWLNPMFILKTEEGRHPMTYNKGSSSLACWNGQASHNRYVWEEIEY